MSARPTEYRGIVFKSKSEAVFARCLDLSPLVDDWIYEPKGFAHAWDFGVQLTRYMYYWDEPWPRDIGWSALIEYKPTEPTMTYVNNLIEKVRDESQSPQFGWQSYIVWGNPWSGPPFKTTGKNRSYVAYPVFARLQGEAALSRCGWGGFSPRPGEWDFNELYPEVWGRPFSWLFNFEQTFGVTEAMAQEARRYRFDLKSLEIKHE